MVMGQISDRELHEECGVFGVFGVKDAASLTYYGLHALQHRGQEGAGIVTVDRDATFRRIKGGGLVTEVFGEGNLSTLKGDMAIGHVRYTTAGGGGIENVQPFLFRHNTGDFALAHNGNIVNSALLRIYLENKGSLFQSTSDSEILAHLIKKETKYHDRPRIYSIIDALNMIEGAFAFLIMTANRIYACRDKYGLRPLSIGRLGDGYVVSSETCAFDVLGAEFVRDVEPGEIVTIDSEGIRSRDFSQYKRCEMCSMEYIYFARPDSDIEGCNVHAYRKESGRLLFGEAPAEADIVVGVPDSSLSAAMGYAEASGLPYEMGLIKNKYIGRTFIQPSQELREKGVRMKLSAVRTIVKGKRVVLVDDSIVRGTTSRLGVMGNIGAFGGMFDLSALNVKEPVLVSGTDGVGTKLKLAFEMDKHDTIGVDAVAMCVNDVLAQGAEPLVFLDYVAVGHNEPQKIEAIVSGVADGCRQAGCALVGGETAEMPGMYSEGEYDIAGFTVGVVEKSKLIDGSKVRAGDVLVGIASSGVHSNGFSLVRKILADNCLDLHKVYPELSNKLLGEVLLTPTKIYVKQVLEVIRSCDVHGISHITGGGFDENIPRILHEGQGLEIEEGTWEILPVFRFLEKYGKVAHREMFNIFNMGIGMVIALDASQAEKAIAILAEQGEKAAVIGRVTDTEGVVIR